MKRPRGYLLDTNVLVALIRGNRLGKWIDAQYELRKSLPFCAISVVTVGEMYSLAQKFGWGKAKLRQLDSLLDEVVWIDIGDYEILRAYADVDQASEAVGRSMGKNDLWIAATCKATQLVLLTTDRDFDHLHGKHLTRNWIDPSMGRSSP